MTEAKLAEIAWSRGRLLLRPEESAEIIGVSRARLYEILGEPGGIRSIKVGRSRRIPVSEIEDWIARQLAEQAR